jgi:hypothetical protein
MPYCSQCGKPIKQNASFCSECGNPTRSVIDAQLPGSQPVTGSETILAIVPNLLKTKSMVQRDTFFMIGTQSRAVFVKITQSLAQKAIELNKERLAQKGGGFWGKWKDQVMGPNIYVQYLQTISLQQALGESPDNFALDNAQITRVRCSYRDEDPSEWHLEFQTTGGTHKFITTDNPEQLLKDLFGPKVTK